VLASLLPGVRELRAPLAAGYLWLMSGWLAWTPECGDSALTDAMCRLDSLISVLGLAVVTSFAAFQGTAGGGDRVRPGSPVRPR
jgi:hypothetical protein